MTDLAAYRELFVNRSDVFAEQQKDGAYFPVRRELSDDDIAEHLAGFASYGTYVISPETVVDNDGDIWLGFNTVKYVVFDLDTYDEHALEHLKWCVKALVRDLFGPYDEEHPTVQAERMDEGLKSLLLESSGGKGFHVWLFLSEPLPAVQVRRWLGWAFWPLWLEAAADAPEWPALEVFPKQDSVDEGGFGNLVKCPLGKHAVTGNISHFLGVTDWANGVSSVMPLDASLVPALEVTAEENVSLPGVSAPRTGVTPFPCIDRCMSGDMPRGVRDEGMFHLALFLYGNGLDQDLALAQCRKVNERMEKPLTDREVVTKVKSAYTGRSRGSCAPDWLRSFCPGPCPKYGFSKSATGGVLGRLKAGDTVEVEVQAVQASGGRKRVTLAHPDAENTPTLVLKG